MIDEDIERAAALLAENWRSDGHIDSLAVEGAPIGVDQGYEIQARLAARLATPQVGWKIAATSSGGQQHVRVDHPLIGRLFADRVYPAPSTLLIRDNRMRVAEAEFCFRFGRDLPDASGTLGRDEVMESVDALFPAIELPDSRFIDFVAAGAPSLIADNACAREFLLGDEVGGAWRDIAFDRYSVSVYVNDVEVVRGSGGDVLGDPRDALTWFVNECARRGMTLKSGHIVTTGVVGRPVPINASDHIRADFGVLGVVELTMSDATID
jgi:2-keto-4-pentenoate hydratase